jgi:hypothetical protein
MELVPRRIGSEVFAAPRMAKAWRSWLRGIIGKPFAPPVPVLSYVPCDR